MKYKIIALVLAVFVSGCTAIDGGAGEISEEEKQERQDVEELFEDDLDEAHEDLVELEELFEDDLDQVHEDLDELEEREYISKLK